MGIGSSTESRAPNVLFTIAPNEVHIVTSFLVRGWGCGSLRGLRLLTFLSNATQSLGRPWNSQQFRFYKSNFICRFTATLEVFGECCHLGFQTAQLDRVATMQF